MIFALQILGHSPKPLTNLRIYRLVNGQEAKLQDV